MISKKNIIYIASLCVLLVFTLAAFILSFFLESFFGVLGANDCTSYSAKIVKIESPTADMVALKVVDAKVWDEDEEDDNNSDASEKAGVSCTVVLSRHDMVEEADALLKEDAEIVFLVEEGEVKEGGEAGAVALKVRSDSAAQQDKDVATLSLHESEKLEKVKYAQIGMLCGVLLFFAGGVFCMIKLCSKKNKW